MNRYSETERVIDLKDLLYRTVKAWRKIIVGAIVVALLAAAYQVYSGARIMLSAEKLAEAQEKYRIAVDDYEATGERLRTNIANLRDQTAKQQEYNQKSVLMKIDPMNKWVGNLQIYIDSKYQIDPQMSYQNVDLTNRLIAAYTSYLRSGELYNVILNEIDSVDEIRFLTEIYGVSSDPANAIITFNCVGRTEEDVRELLNLVKQKITERYPTIANAIGDHSFDYLTESVYSTIDLDLDAKQKTNLSVITENANSIAGINEELTSWGKKNPPEMKFGVAYTAKQAAKSCILGGILGLVVLFLWFAARYVVSRTVKTEADWRGFGVPVLGCICKERNVRHFRGIDRWIDRGFGQDRILTPEQSCQIVAHNLGAILQTQGLHEAHFVGNVDRTYAEALIRAMDAAVPEIHFAFAGDALTQPDTAQNLGAEAGVIVLAENQTTPLKSIHQTLTLLQAWGKTVLGAVVIE